MKSTVRGPVDSDERRREQPEADTEPGPCNFKSNVVACCRQVLEEDEPAMATSSTGSRNRCAVNRLVPRLL